MYHRYLIYYVVINNSMYNIEDYILDRFGDLGDVDLTYVNYPIFFNSHLNLNSIILIR